MIQIVINRDDIQGYAAKTVFEALQSPSCHENMVRVGGYILGEFGNLIAGDPRSRYGYFFQTLFRLFCNKLRYFRGASYVLNVQGKQDLPQALHSIVRIRAWPKIL